MSKLICSFLILAIFLILQIKAGHHHHRRHHHHHHHHHRHHKHDKKADISFLNKGDESKEDKQETHKKTRTDLPSAEEADSGSEDIKDDTKSDEKGALLSSPDKENENTDKKDTNKAELSQAKETEDKEEEPSLNRNTKGDVSSSKETENAVTDIKKEEKVEASPSQETQNDNTDSSKNDKFEPLPSKDTDNNGGDLKKDSKSEALSFQNVSNNTEDGSKPEGFGQLHQNEAKNPESATLPPAGESTLEQHKLPASTKPTAETTPENPQADIPPETGQNSSTPQGNNGTVSQKQALANSSSDNVDCKKRSCTGTPDVTTAFAKGDPLTNGTYAGSDDGGEEYGSLQKMAQPYVMDSDAKIISDVEEQTQVVENQAIKELQNYQKDKVRSRVNTAPPSLKSLLMPKETSGKAEAQRYLMTANAAVDAAAEAVADAASLDGKREAIKTVASKAKTPEDILKIHDITDKGEPIEGSKKASVKYFRAASQAVAAAHEALAKAANEAGFKDLPGPNLAPLEKEPKKQDAAKAKDYIVAANGAVNAAEKALDNLAAAGFPEIIPSMSASQKKEGISTMHQKPNAEESEINGSGSGTGEGHGRNRIELQNQFIAVANKAVNAAHTALVQIQEADDAKQKNIGFFVRPKTPLQERRSKSRGN